MVEEEFTRHVAAGRKAKFAAAALPPGRERSRLFAKAAAEYAAAGDGARSTYALINAASLSRLAGDEEAAKSRSRSVLAMLDSGRHAPDTAYWLAATRAEALLVLGEDSAARVAMYDAICKAPEAWEDHAITLRQFRLLSTGEESGASWIEAFRPPPVLYFAGLIGIAGDDELARGYVTRAIGKIGPCMGFGALAAGTDILAAEALLEAGAELHVVLPARSDLFRSVSVAGSGSGWVSRFDRCLASASSVAVIPGGGDLNGSAVAMAGEIAMGLAIGKAAELETRAVALRTFAPRNAGSPMAGLWDRWRAQGLPVNAIPLERTALSNKLSPARQSQPAALLAAGGGSMRRECFSSMAQALAAAREMDDCQVALDYVLASGPPDDDDWVFAEAAVAAADGPGIVASGCALAAARLAQPGLVAETAGSVRHRRGQTDVHALRLPQSAG